MARVLAVLVAAGGAALGLALVAHGVDETRELFHDAADLTVVWVLSGLAFAGAALLGAADFSGTGKRRSCFAEPASAPCSSLRWASSASRSF